MLLINEKRKLTPIGRITVIKSLILPLFTHCFFSIPTPKIDILDKLNKLLFDFVWENKHYKMKSSTIIQNYDKGGLQMVDIYAYCKKIKLSWLRKLYSCSESKCIILIRSMIDVGKLFNTGIQYTVKIKNSLKNQFWSEVFSCYEQLLESVNMHDVDNILNMPLFYNENFMTGNEPFFLKTLYDRGIRFVRDIAIDSKSFLNKTQIEMITGKTINFILYEGLVKSIKTLFNKLNLIFL